VAALLLCGNARAEVTTIVVDVPTRDATQRFLYVRPNAPSANVVFLPGNTGVLGIANDGSMMTLPGRCAPFARNRDALAARGMSLALVDRTSDGKIRQVGDIREVVRHLRARDDVPTWIVGGSASTNAALAYVAQAPADERLGLIVFSPGQPDAALAMQIGNPALILFHERDEHALPFVGTLFEALASPVKERVALSGGIAKDECGGHHLFRGIDAEFVAAVAGFVERHNRLMDRATPSRR
jgi:pimeloyl-ACP methyl ester carboxylesterase